MSVNARDRTMPTGGVSDSGLGRFSDRSLTTVSVIVKVADAPLSVSSMMPSRLLSRITLPAMTACADARRRRSFGRMHRAIARPAGTARQQRNATEVIPCDW